MAVTAIFVSIFANCNNAQKKMPRTTGDGITGVEVYYNWELFSPEQNGILRRKDSFDIFYIGENTIYRLGTEYVANKVHVADDGELITDSILTKEIKYKYFVFTNSDTDGFLFDSLQDTKPKQREIKSYLASKLSFSETMFSTDKYKRTESLILHNGDIFEAYSSAPKIDESYPDSLYYYFSDTLRNVDFTFSRSQDSLKQKKLVKAIFLFNTYKHEGLSMQIPRRELVFALRPVSTKSLTDITVIISSYNALRAGKMPD